MPMIRRASVDLPPPLGPVMTTNCSSGTTKLTPRMISRVLSASSTPKVTFFSSSMFSLCDLSL